MRADDPWLYQHDMNTKGNELVLQAFGPRARSCFRSSVAREAGLRYSGSPAVAFFHNDGMTAHLAQTRQGGTDID